MMREKGREGREGREKNECADKLVFAAQTFAAQMSRCIGYKPMNGQLWTSRSTCQEKLASRKLNKSDLQTALGYQRNCMLCI